MKFAMKTLVAAAAVAAAGLANAAAVTLNVGDEFKGLTASGSGTLAFSQQLLGALDSGQVLVEGVDPAIANVVLDADGYYLAAEASAPITSLTIDDVTNTVLAAQTAGGALQTTTFVKSISNGGILSVTDLNVDLANNMVRARVQGANAAGTYNFDQVIDLWSIGSITGDTTVTGPGVYTTTLGNLAITQQGFDVFVASLDLIKGGVTALQGVDDFGTITSVITATAVPEPSTYAMMGVGLLAVGAAVRRRAAK